MKKIFAALVLALVALFVVVFSASASNGFLQEPPAGPDLATFLKWLMGGPGSIMAVSWLLERMKWFQALPPDGKDWTIFTAATLVGGSAYAVVMFVPAAVLTAIAPFFLIVSSIFVLVFIAKAFHRADKLPQ